MTLLNECSRAGCGRRGGAPVGRGFRKAEKGKSNHSSNLGKNLVTVAALTELQYDIESQ